MMKKGILFCALLFLGLSVFSQVVINPCAQAKNIHVVVIGSSTAAGAGPSNSSNAWVNRFRVYMEGINPNNLVTNLAVGGTTTYHIMPDWFATPSGRPNVTPAKNVSQAIALGADAIIVNMPSNDASNGFGLNEQMFNFITISNVADSAGIPVWVCTTQPKNFSVAKKAIQAAVRDSIFSYFGPKAIDFWNGFADSTDGLATFYDSGDGTHMNDTAHGVLNNLVIAEGIPNLVSDTLPYADHIVSRFYLDNPGICGDSNTVLNAVITNLGIAATATQTVNFQQINNVNSSISNTPIVMTSILSACASDTVSYTFNSYNGVDYDLQSYLTGVDTDKTNDTSGVINLLTNGHPILSVMNDTICVGDSTILNATTGANDTIVWYDALVGGNIIGYGNQFSVNGASSSQSYFPEAVRGPLHFAKSLFTTATTTTNWNGMMFDIIATDTIIIDSLQIKVNSTGLQLVTAYNRLGSLVGNENTAAAWTSWGIDNVNAIIAGEYQTVDLPDVTLYPNDTLGVYLHMANGATLSYRNSAATTYANTEVMVKNGTGVSYTFGTIYSPRNWSGEVFYHYGFNPQGDCSSERKEIAAVVSQPTLNLGNDTNISWAQSILLNNNTTFNTYKWSNTDLTPQLLVDSNNFSFGQNSIWLEAINKFGCKASDTIEVTFTTPTALSVRMLQFGISANKKGILLNWKTAAEKNTKHFTIQKSENGSAFFSIGNVAAKSILEPNAGEYNYQFLDKNPSFGKNYYRLEEEDFSGKKSYSDIKLQEWLLGKNNVTLYPNPVSDKLNVKVSSPINGLATVRVIDIQGRIVFGKTANILKGSNLVQLNLSELAAGQYEIQFVLNGKYSYSSKVVLE